MMTKPTMVKIMTKILKLINNYDDGHRHEQGYKELRPCPFLVLSKSKWVGEPD